MQIELRQTEIEKAVRQYVAGQGISLQNKTMGIAFSATRDKDKGIVAILNIEEIASVGTAVEIPGFTDRPADKATVAQLAGTPKVVSSAADVTTLALAASNTAPVADTAAASTNVAAAPADQAPAVTDTPADVTGDKTVPEDVALADAAGKETPAETKEPEAAAAPAADAKPNTTSLFG